MCPVGYLGVVDEVQGDGRKVGNIYKVIIDSKEGGNFIGRTEFDSPEVDNEVLIDASQHYLRIGDFANIKITRAEEFDLFGEPV